MIKLPKQWKHWCKKARLGVEGNNKSVWARKTDWCSLVGKGRHWRINCYGEFQVSEPHSNFDRWANSTSATYEGVPSTEVEFLEAIKWLLSEAARNEENAK